MKKLLLICAVLAGAFLFFNLRFFYIPSTSMAPTVRLGDYVLAWKMSYGWSRYSFPFAPDFISGRIWPTPPARGDVVVFKDPRDGHTDYIKRVIGLPGDRVRMENGRLLLNDALVPREPAGTTPMTDAFNRKVDAAVYRENLGAPAASHLIVEADGDTGTLDNTEQVTVPPNHYFVMGDNRDNSADSRAPSSVGFVPFENFVGKVVVVLFSDAPAGTPEGRRILVPVQ